MIRTNVPIQCWWCCAPNVLYFNYGITVTRYNLFEIKYLRSNV